MTMTFRWPIAIATGVALAVAGSSVGVATATGAFSGPRAVPESSGSQPTQVASLDSGIARPDASQIAAFSAFARAPQSQDLGATDPGLLQGLNLAQQQFAVNPSLGRNVYSDASTQIYIYPGRGAMCFGAVSSQTGTTVGCTTTAAAVERGLGSHLTLGEMSIVQGVLPAGTHDVVVTDAAGRKTAVNLTADGGYVAQLSTPPAKLTYTGRSGTQHEQDLP